jgi:hypothetical protein
MQTQRRSGSPPLRIVYWLNRRRYGRLDEVLLPGD